MKILLTILALIFGTFTANAYDENKKIEDKLAKEILEHMEQQNSAKFSVVEEYAIIIYDQEGNVLHQFKENSIDAKAMRNAELLMESKTQKIFIKYRN